MYINVITNLHMSIVSKLKFMDDILNAVLKPLPQIVSASSFRELCTLIVECIRTNWTSFTHIDTGRVQGTLGGTDFYFCMNECDPVDGHLRITYELKTTDNKFIAPSREYTYIPGQNQFETIVVYISTYTSKFSTMDKVNKGSGPYWYP
jgi:hypothetical protein